MRMTNAFNIIRHIKNELTGVKGDIYTNGNGCEFKFFDGKSNYKIMVLVDAEANAKMEMEEKDKYIKMCMNDPRMMREYMESLNEDYCYN